MNLAKAIAIASVGFEHKTDKAGEPYIMHCLRVMNNPKCDTPERKILAVLHDVIEDGIYTEKELLVDHGFHSSIVLKLTKLSHRRDLGQTYDEYIKIVSTDDDCTAVKLADLEDNSQITRLKGLGKKDFDRMEKYHRAYIYLSRR